MRQHSTTYLVTRAIARLVTWGLILTGTILALQYFFVFLWVMS